MTSRPSGRPREFDPEQAVRDAARLFWRHGFSGTSTRMLTNELMISSSSLYAAFGSKASLFDAAVRTHIRRYALIYERAVQEENLGDVIRRLLIDSVVEFTGMEDEDAGCLTNSAAMADTSDTLNVRAFVGESQQKDEALLRARIERAVMDGEVPDYTDAVALSDLVQSLWHGLSVRANLGVERSELLGTAELACGVFERAFSATESDGRSGGA
ncbi:MAG TPA: TetR/AcrR family transcriptional regulator [Candidatus Agrococcus pullicola]|uniref:TetR/AcrR family transcriptional regulator n=1 Tax=Candidatus Agrococcus pullicola TaxID=2838429 RepID=A0A9D1YXL9_9MICO|nr:TetR/AcrR family transcriptional regulator [Candidatus Agrococcus pullicola]